MHALHVRVIKLSFDTISQSTNRFALTHPCATGQYRLVLYIQLSDRYDCLFNRNIKIECYRRTNARWFHISLNNVGSSTVVAHLYRSSDATQTHDVFHLPSISSNFILCKNSIFESVDCRYLRSLEKFFIRNLLFNH